MKTALILRAGGLGDILVLTPVARELHKRGYLVDFFCGSPTGKVFEMIQGLPYINQAKEITRVAGVQDCVDEDGHLISVDIIKSRYDEVFDYKFSVEENFAGLHKREAWRTSINSNFQNWIDLFLSWANIDPSKVEYKRPEINLTDNKYHDWVATETPILSKDIRDCKVIGIQLQASSLLRTWYKAADLPELIHKKYPNDIVVIFSNKWICITPNGRQEIVIPEGMNPLLCSAAIISEMDCFISADSGSSHIGEAVSTPTITVYTTVPSWTREKYYKYSYPIDAGVECSPCFTLDTFCPLEKIKAEQSLTEREKGILESAKKNENPMDVAKKYNVPPMAIQMEFDAIGKKLQAQATTEPACVKSITADMILNKLDQVLGGIHQRPVTKVLNFHENVLVEDFHE